MSALVLLETDRTSHEATKLQNACLVESVWAAEDGQRWLHLLGGRDSGGGSRVCITIKQGKQQRLSAKTAIRGRRSANMIHTNPSSLDVHQSGENIVWIREKNAQTASPNFYLHLKYKESTYVLGTVWKSSWFAISYSLSRSHKQDFHSGRIHARLENLYAVSQKTSKEPAGYGFQISSNYIVFVRSELLILIRNVQSIQMGACWHLSSNYPTQKLSAETIKSQVKSWK